MAQPVRFLKSLLVLLLLWSLNSEAVEYRCPSTNERSCPVDNCAFVNRANVEACRLGCFGDHDCVGRTSLCCPNDCGIFHCRPAIEVPDGTCPSQARVGTSCEGSCALDSECRNYEKCCRTTCSNGASICAPTLESRVQNLPISTFERPGQCPSLPFIASSCVENSCQYDSNCPQGQKCCRARGYNECTMELCMEPVTQVIPVNPNVVLRASCPLQRLVDENPIHECNDRSTCGDGKLCCANRHNKGRCTQVLANQISENVGAEVREGVCREPDFVCSEFNSYSCSGPDDDAHCFRSDQKCCPDARGSYCCQSAPAHAAITRFGEVRSNSLVARQYLMPFNWQCVTFIDKTIQLIEGRPILKFQLMMLSMQDLLNDATVSVYPPLRLQLWTAVATEPGAHPNYMLVCEKRIAEPLSIPRQLLYEFDVSDDECFRNPQSGDKMGFTFELFRDDTRLLTVIPVPYDYFTDYNSPTSGKTDYRLDPTCERLPEPNGEAVTMTSNAASFPGSWSVGVVQAASTIP